MVLFTKNLVIAFWIIVGAYLVYQLFLKKDPLQEEYDKLYDTIINSEKYKVKGQFEK